MRARLIKPGYFKNDELAELPPLARILFAGLWCLSDRDGRLKDRPKAIKAEVLPYDDCDADAMLDDLACAGFIVRYGEPSARFIQVVNFGKHQTPHVKEAASTIPAPCLSDASTGGAALNPVPIPIPDPVPVPVTREAGATAPAQPHYSATFEAFWRQYPRREKKPGAWSAWQKIAPPRGPTGEMADAILAGVATWLLSEQWQRGIYPHAATWLNGRQWEDEPAMAGPPRASPNGRQGTQDILAEAFGRNGTHDSSDPGNDNQPPVYDVALSSKDRPRRASADGGILVGSPRLDG
jgi:hypothetical protein